MPKHRPSPAAVIRSQDAYHGLGCKHVFVPELEVFNIFQDYLFIFPALKEIGAANDSRSPRRLVPLNVHCIWLIVGLDSPGENKRGGGGVSPALTGQQTRPEERGERRQEVGVTHRGDTYQEKDFTCS